MEAATAHALRVPAPGGALNRLRSDRRLAERFRAGDDAAFAVLYERHRHRLLAICIGVVGSYEDAQDALQNALAAAAASLRKTSPDDVRAWLSRVVRNAAIDVVRSRRATAPLLTEEPSPGYGPDGLALQREDLGRLVDSLRRLPEQQRTALVMRELAGSSYAEVADALEVDETAVRGLIARGRMSLRAELEASELACATVREELAHQPDGRRRPAVMRRHIRSCDGCREFAAGVRTDARALRSLVPSAGLGLIGVASLLRLTRPVAVGGAVAKGAFGTGAIQAVVACAVCVTAAEGVREMAVQPAPRSASRSAAPAPRASGDAAAATSAARYVGTRSEIGTGSAGATAERRAQARRRTAANRLRRDRAGAFPPPIDGSLDEEGFGGGGGVEDGGYRSRDRGHGDGGSRGSDGDGYARAQRDGGAGDSGGGGWDGGHHGGGDRAGQRSHGPAPAESAPSTAAPAPEPAAPAAPEVTVPDTGTLGE